MRIHKIIVPVPYQIRTVNIFLVEGEALSLFDAGINTPEAYHALTLGVQQAGYQLTDIEQIVLTHHHPDHIGLAGALPNAKVLGHTYNAHLLQHEPLRVTNAINFYSYYYTKFGVPKPIIEKFIQNKENSTTTVGKTMLTTALQAGDIVPGHANLQVLETPGHAKSHLVFLDEYSGEAISGDVLLEKTIPNPLIEYPLNINEQRDKPQLIYNETIKDLATLPLTKLYTGHGADISGVSDFIAARTLQQHDKSLRVWHLLGTERLSVFAITARLYPGIYEKELLLTISKAVGYLDYLQQIGKVQCYEEAGVQYYERK